MYSSKKLPAMLLPKAPGANSKLGSGCADGLVASLMPDETVHTAALEANSQPETGA